MSRIQELRCKEVINLHNGQRLGFVIDVEIDTCTGQIVSLILPNKCKIFGLFGKTEDIIIPWCDVEKIGEDLILVKIKLKETEVIRRRCKENNFCL